MDIGYTYGSPKRMERFAMYLPPNYEAPEQFNLTTTTGDEVEFWRLSDRSLACYKADDGCGSYECHRQNLGVCQCGAHKGVVYPQRARPGEESELRDPRPPRIVKRGRK